MWADEPGQTRREPGTGVGSKSRQPTVVDEESEAGAIATSCAAKYTSLGARARALEARDDGGPGGGRRVLGRVLWRKLTPDKHLGKRRSWRRQVWIHREVEKKGREMRSEKRRLGYGDSGAKCRCGGRNLGREFYRRTRLDVQVGGDT